MTISHALMLNWHRGQLALTLYVYVPCGYDHDERSVRSVTHQIPPHLSTVTDYVGRFIQLKNKISINDVSVTMPPNYWKSNNVSDPLKLVTLAFLTKTLN